VIFESVLTPPSVRLDDQIMPMLKGARGGTSKQYAKGSNISHLYLSPSHWVECPSITL
jgi:hypothetical protein